MYPISIVRLPAIARRACAVASPVRTSSTICGTVNPCAIMTASVQPSRECSEQFERAATLGIGLLARYWLGHLTLEELGDKMLAELRRV